MTQSILLGLTPNDLSGLDIVQTMICDESDMQGYPWTRVDQLHLIGVRSGPGHGLVAVALVTDGPRAALPVSPIADVLDAAARALTTEGAVLVTRGAVPTDRLFGDFDAAVPSPKSVAAATKLEPLLRDGVPLTFKSSRYTVAMLPAPLLAVLGVTVAALRARERVSVEAVPARLSPAQFARAAGMTLEEVRQRIVRGGMLPVATDTLHEPLFARAEAFAVRNHTMSLRAAPTRRRESEVVYPPPAGGGARTDTASQVAAGLAVRSIDAAVVGTAGRALT